MSLPKRLYELFRELLETELVKSRKATAETMLAFQNLLNQANPTSEAESAQHELVRGIYFSNPGSFAEYLRDRRNRAGALVLWTESKRIAKFFNLDGVVHISWDETEKNYRVVAYVARDKRERDVSKTESMIEVKDSGISSSNPNDNSGSVVDDSVTVEVKDSEVLTSPPQSYVSAQPYLNRRARRAAENAAKPKGVKSKRGLAAMKYTKETRPQRFTARTYVDQRESYDDYADQQRDHDSDRRQSEPERKQVLRREYNPNRQRDVNTQQRERDTQQPQKDTHQREPSRRTVTYQPKVRPPRPPHPLRTINEVPSEESTSQLPVSTNTVAAGASWADVAVSSN